MEEGDWCGLAGGGCCGRRGSSAWLCLCSSSACVYPSTPQQTHPPPTLPTRLPRSIAIMARGRLRCIGTSLRLKARFGSGYRVSIRLAGADGGPAAGASAAPAAPTGGFNYGARAAANPLFEVGEIQPDSGSPRQQQRRHSPGSGGSGAGAGQDLHLRDAATAAQAAAVRALFMAQLGIKPSECRAPAVLLHLGEAGARSAPTPLPWSVNESPACLNFRSSRPPPSCPFATLPTPCQPTRPPPTCTS